MEKTTGIIVIAGILLTAVIIENMLSSQNKKDLRSEIQKNKPAAGTIVIKNENYSKTIKSSGRMQAFEKIELFVEVSGVLSQNSSNFRAGKKFQKGEILLSIDDEVYKNSLFAQKSNLLNQLTLLLPDLKIDFPQEYQKWDDYLANFEISKSLSVYY